MKRLEIKKHETVNRMVNSLLGQAGHHYGITSLKGLTIKNFNYFLDDLFNDGGEVRCINFTDLAIEYALQFGEIESTPFNNAQWSCIESAIKKIQKRVE